MKSEDKANGIIFNCPILKCYDVFPDYFVSSTLHIPSAFTRHFYQVGYYFSLIPLKTKIIRKPQKIAFITVMILQQGPSYKKP